MSARVSSPDGRSGQHPRRGVRPTADHRIVLSSATWEHYELELAMRVDRSGPRLAYLDGAQELMQTSRQRITSYLGRLIETYAEHADIQLSPYRSWTLTAGQTCGCEPDECYIIGTDQSKDHPALIIGVIEQSFPKEVAKVRARGIDPLRMTMSDAQTAAEKTLANAVETGILKRDKVVPRLSDIRDKLEAIAGKGVDLSVVKRGGKFDRGPYFPVP